MAKRGVRMDGVTFKRYFEDNQAWPEGTYYDDAEILIDGTPFTDGVDTDALADNAIIEIRDGLILHESDVGVDGTSLVSHARRWLKQQTLQRLIVEVDADKLDAVRMAVKAAGGVIL